MKVKINVKDLLWLQSFCNQDLTDNRGFAQIILTKIVDQVFLVGTNGNVILFYEPYEVYEYEKKTITVDDYDPETGEVIGHHTEEVDDLEKPIMVEEVDPETGETIRVHKHHTETRTEWVERLEIVDGDNSGVLKAQLEALDKKSIRSLRAVVSGTATEDDKSYLASLERQARDIRDGLVYGM